MEGQPIPHFSRRALLETVMASCTLPVFAQTAADAQATGPGPRSFHVGIPQAAIDRILTRVRETRWPDRLETPDWSYGANWDYMKALAEYWTTRFDWRKAEANLNRHPQFLARVGDFDIHFYHVKGRGPKPVPLILTHGWPGSVLEFVEAIGPLTDPARFGGSPDDAFDVVVPSVPGFGFSSKPKGKPVGLTTTATLWNRLMTEVLGYKKYGAQGGDVGNGVTNQLAHAYADSLLGIHFNGLGVPPPPEAEQSPEEREWARTVTAFVAVERDYYNEQQHKPETVAFALTDNPLGTGAWIAEKLKLWSDSPDPREPVFTMDQVLTNIMIYLVTDTIGTSAWFYRGRVDEPSNLTGKVNVPTGFASFPRELPTLDPPRSVIERNFNLVHYTKMPHGGHFACWEQPQLLVTDLRNFFRPLRPE
ncbi:MAG TPA: epoxide hydrolase [Verrucomicrobiae bacterium]|jgi:pimeloyl-ACP methyl ester carboxylesterase|nr:epoxide hydrolase [Verrucomicrobiae bacterium]